MDFDLGAEADLVRADFIGIHDLDILEELFELGDAGLNVALLILCSIVFSVLGEVALRAGLLELRRDFLAAVDLEILQLILVLAKTFVGQNGFLYIFVRCFHTLLQLPVVIFLMR